MVPMLGIEERSAPSVKSTMAISSAAAAASSLETVRSRIRRCASVSMGIPVPFQEVVQDDVGVAPERRDHLGRRVVVLIQAVDQIRCFLEVLAAPPLGSRVMPPLRIGPGERDADRVLDAVPLPADFILVSVFQR